MLGMPDFFSCEPWILNFTRTVEGDACFLIFNLFSTILIVIRSKLLKNKSELLLSINWELLIRALLLVSLTIIQG
jgi:hypothetical protein